MTEQRAGMHIQGQANSGGYNQSAQRQFENQQNVAMAASSSSNMQPNSKSNSKAGNFFRRNASNQSGKAHANKNSSVGSQGAMSNQVNNHGNVIHQHYPMQKQNVVGSRQSSGGGHSAHHSHQMNHGATNSSRIIQ